MTDIDDYINGATENAADLAEWNGVPWLVWFNPKSEEQGTHPFDTAASETYILAQGGTPVRRVYPNGMFDDEE